MTITYLSTGIQAEATLDITKETNQRRQPYPIFTTCSLKDEAI